MEGMAESVKRYSKFEMKYNMATNNRSYQAGPVLRHFEEAKKREVRDFEVGREPERMNERFSLKEVHANVKYMVEDLKSVEMAIGGSKEFKEMKESLLDFQKFVDTNMKREQYGEKYDPQEFQMMQAKIARTMQDTKKYLDHKEKQFKEDAKRRDSASKQKREQPRIRMAVSMMDKLQFLSAWAEAKEKERNVNLEKAYMQKTLPKVKAAQKEKTLGKNRRGGWKSKGSADKGRLPEIALQGHGVL